MRREVLVEWNPWWEKKVDFDYVKRNLIEEIIPWIERKEIVSLLGVRRSGKTTLMYLIIEYLINNNVSPKNILFVKCDDDRVEKKGLIDTTIKSYKELINPKGRIHIFLDEIQEIEDWEKTLKRIYDLEKDLKIFISGSNFSMLREDLGYKLSGRTSSFEVYPFSFCEFIKIKFKNLEKISLLSNPQEIKHYLLEYLEFGGFPEVTLEEDEELKTQLLEFYFDSIIYRDVIKRRKIRNPKKMEKVINFLLQNISNPIVFSKIGKNFSLSTDTVGEYSGYLQEAFFTFIVPLFSYSVKAQEINPKKVYCVDTGIRNIKGFRFSEDIGRLMGNLVFSELKRTYSSKPLVDIFYFKDEKQREVDFVVKDGTKIKNLIQVCFDIKNEKIRKREVDGIVSGLKKFKLKKGLIITEDYEEKEIVDGKTVVFVPLWKWLLDLN